MSVEVSGRLWAYGSSRPSDTTSPQVRRPEPPIRASSGHRLVTSEPQVAIQHVVARVATTHPLNAYGGVQLAPSVIDELVDHVNRVGMPMFVNHDPRRRWQATNVSARVEHMKDGERAAVLEFDIDEDISSS
jgi:hypothetical protein